MEDAAILNFSTKCNNSAAGWGVVTKFGRNINSCKWKQAMWPYSTLEVNSRWRRPPFLIPFNAHNTVAIAYICTKLGTKTENGVQETAIALNFSYHKIQDSGVRHFEFPQNSNSAAGWGKVTKFGPTEGHHICWQWQESTTTPRSRADPPTLIVVDRSGMSVTLI